MKTVFIGAGSTVFVKNLIGDIFLSSRIPESMEIALYDIDSERLEDSRRMIDVMNQRYNHGNATITVHLGPSARREALRNADFVINAIQVGGYKPATVVDFDIPKKYGLRQTIGDTLGIGGIFRGLRTVPVVLDIASEIEQVAPGAWFLNYTNPMSIVTGAILHGTGVRTVGLCHSVQVCAPRLVDDLAIPVADLRWKIAGINHMAWLLDIRDGDIDIYPEVRHRALEKNRQAFNNPEKRHHDMVRYEVMRLFGYYLTESSEHNAEYMPYWIKTRFPELIDRFHIPLDEYLTRCETQIEQWTKQRTELMNGEIIEHERSREYAADIIGAIVDGTPTRIHGNIVNDGLITNLPDDAIVEIPCLVDSNGVQGVRVGSLPPQLAALNQTNINVHALTIEAALSKRRDHVYHAALLDPHTAAELPPDQIIAMCDELFTAHEEWLPEYR